jgi:hypothetical protein
MLKQFADSKLNTWNNQILYNMITYTNCAYEVFNIKSEITISLVMLYRQRFYVKANCGFKAKHIE